MAARPASHDRPPVRFDRTTALGVGMLLGLGTVFLDRLLPQRRQPVAAAPPVDRRPLAVAKRVLKEFGEDRIPAVAAGATFYILLALFPALGVFVSLYGLFADVQDVPTHVAELAGFLPAGGVSILEDQMTRLATAPSASLGLTFVISLLLSVWSANAGVRAVIAGLNVAYEAHERRSFLTLNLASLGFTVGGIVFAVLAVLTVAAAPDLLARIGLAGWTAASWLRWPAMFVVAAIALSVLFRFAPSGATGRWRWITPGGVIAALGWVAMSWAFSLYVGRFGHYDRTYGSLGALAGFMTWIWLSLIVVLLGAEINSELERVAGGPDPLKGTA